LLAAGKPLQQQKPSWMLSVNQRSDLRVRPFSRLIFWLLSQGEGDGRLGCLVRHQIPARKPRNFGLGVRDFLGLRVLALPGYWSANSPSAR
jgi:hypothetical protein